jgi:hypothetical protein
MLLQSFDILLILFPCWHALMPPVLRYTGRVPLMLLAGLSSPSLDSCSIEVEKAKVLKTSHSRWLHSPLCQNALRFFVIRFILGYFRCLDWTAKASCVYHQLLCAMHIYDVLESLWNFASTWPIPARTTGIWATTQPCNTQRFFLQFGLAIHTMMPLVYIIFLSFDVICKIQS